MKHPLLEATLQGRNLPDPLLVPETGLPANAGDWFLHRECLLNLLAREEYGFMPSAPSRAIAVKSGPAMFMKEEAVIHERYELTCETPGGPFSFPFDLFLPTSEEKVPVFIQASFFPDVPNQSCPVDEITGRGFGVASFCYTDVASDQPEGLAEGLAGLFGAPDRDESGSGTIGYWAWAAQRVMDFLTTHPRVRADRVAIVGHSRLGKTALWGAATDTRFHLAVSVQSGCSGAAITRDKEGERVADISRVFPHWFCRNYAQYAGKEENMPFDQHMLLAAIAPRLLYVCSAQDDQWADPSSEFLGCLAASPAWEAQGKTGFVTPDELPVSGSFLPDGEIGYHLRSGGHALQAEDWRMIMDFWQRHQER